MSLLNVACVSLLSCSSVQHLVPGLTHSLVIGGGETNNWVTRSESVADLGEKGNCSWGVGGGNGGKADRGCTGSGGQVMLGCRGFSLSL